MKRELDDVKMQEAWGYLQCGQNRIDNSMYEYERSVSPSRILKKILGFEKGKIKSMNSGGTRRTNFKSLGGR